MQRKYKLVVVVILGLFLIGGVSMAIIKGVEHLRIERQKRQKAESLKESKKEVKEQADFRQKIALWTVQHFEGPEPIRVIEVGKLESYGILGSGGSAVSVRINEKEHNTLSLQLNTENKPTGGFGRNKQNEFHLKENKNRDLNDVEVRYWEKAK